MIVLSSRPGGKWRRRSSRSALSTSGLDWRGRGASGARRTAHSRPPTPRSRPAPGEAPRPKDAGCNPDQPRDSGRVLAMQRRADWIRTGTGAVSRPAVIGWPPRCPAAPPAANRGCGVRVPICRESLLSLHPSRSPPQLECRGPLAEGHAVGGRELCIPAYLGSPDTAARTTVVRARQYCSRVGASQAELPGVPPLLGARSTFLI